jgi:hypothetical protein
MKKSFIEWIKFKEELQNKGPKDLGDMKTDLNIKNALVNSIKQGQDASKTLGDTAQKIAMDPNTKPESLLKIKDVVDKIKAKSNPKKQMPGSAGQK